MATNKKLQIPNTYPRVRDFLSQHEFITQTCRQLNKDLTGFTLQKVTATTVEPLVHIIPQLNLIVEALAQIGQLQAFIYRVDIDEKQFLAAMSAENFDQLSFLIVQREAQKVYLRHQFKTM